MVRRRRQAKSLYETDRVGAVFDHSALAQSCKFWTDVSPPRPCSRPPRNLLCFCFAHFLAGGGGGGEASTSGERRKKVGGGANVQAGQEITSYTESYGTVKCNSIVVS